MSDRFPCEIVIGGKIPKELQSDLIQVIADSGAGPNWGEEWTKEDLQERIDNGCWLIFVRHDQAPYGEIEDVQAFCREHDIDYNMYSDAYCEHDAYNTSARSGKEFGFLSDQNGSNLIKVDDVRKPIEELLKVLPDNLHVYPTPMFIPDIKKILQHIRDSLNIPPDLTPIEWV